MKELIILHSVRVSTVFKKYINYCQIFYFSTFDFSIHQTRPTIIKLIFLSPVGIFVVACCLSGDGVFEYLPSVDLLLDRATRDEAVYHHILGLPQTEGPVHSLGVRRRVPTRIN